MANQVPEGHGETEESTVSLSPNGPVTVLERLPTNCKVLDTLTDGGLATGTITQIFGEKALGKSILSLQAAYSTVAAGHSAIILDTEQSYFSYLVGYRKGGFEKRFGDKVQVKEVKLLRTTRAAKK